MTAGVMTHAVALTVLCYITLKLLPAPRAAVLKRRNVLKAESLT